MKVRLYADEQFPRPAVECLRNLGHNVLTIQEARNAGASDSEVLAFAIAESRAVLTQNRRNFVKLHRCHLDHSGIIICSNDQNFVRLAERTDGYLCGKTLARLAHSRHATFLIVMEFGRFRYSRLHLPG
jgi:Domain of unknown function (DUF5615)